MSGGDSFLDNSFGRELEEDTTPPERIDDGGPAFPMRPAFTPEGLFDVTPAIDLWGSGFGGISVRDYFAARAPWPPKNHDDIGRLLGMKWEPPEIEKGGSIEEHTQAGAVHRATWWIEFEVAYRYWWADAMIAGRKGRS